MTTETTNEPRPRIETPIGYLDFSLEIAAGWLNQNATDALDKMHTVDYELKDAVERAKAAVAEARRAVRNHRPKVVDIPERPSGSGEAQRP